MSIAVRATVMDADCDAILQEVTFKTHDSSSLDQWNEAVKEDRGNELIALCGKLEKGLKSRGGQAAWWWAGACGWGKDLTIGRRKCVFA